MGMLLVFDILINLMVSWFFVGVIWLVQIVNYPMFTFGASNEEYFTAHSRKMSIVMIPMMLLEMALSITLVLFKTFLYLKVLFWAHLAVNITIWLVTLIFQMPDHHRVKKHFSHENLDLLLSRNWIRIILWSIKGLIIFSASLSSLVIS